jgi:hypothetical protein
MNIEQPKRIKHSYIQTLLASPDKVFPLLCPTLEKEWVQDWDPIKIISRSGIAEKDCIFITPSQPNDSIWIITHYEPLSYMIEMYKVTPGHTVGKLEISLLSESDNVTKANISYEYTALSKDGEVFLSVFTSEWYNCFMLDWEKALNHYLKTGNKIA